MEFDMDAETMRRSIEERIDDYLKEVPEGYFPLDVVDRLSREKIYEITLSNLNAYSITSDYVWLGRCGRRVGAALYRRAGLRDRGSGELARVGVYILAAFSHAGLFRIRLTVGFGKEHPSYEIIFNDPKLLIELVNQLPLERATRVFPTNTPYFDWDTCINESGTSLVKTDDPTVEKLTNVDNQPLVFKSINDAQHIGWKINTEVMEIAEWAFGSQAAPFNNIWQTPVRRSKESKLREANIILASAKKLSEWPEFFHRYYMDFRGRRYPATAYLHEQGTDLAKSLLLRSKGKPIGKKGLFWLCIQIANSWAGDCGRADKRKSDKIPLRDRAKWAYENRKRWISYASNPRDTAGEWAEADAPWQFISYCIELKNFFESGLLPECYVSHIVGYIDGSNNGCQHLTALTKDETMAPYVNLCKQEYPGDLYAHVAQYIWGEIDVLVSLMEPNYRKQLELLVDEVLEIKERQKDIPFDDPDGPRKRAEYNMFRFQHEDDIRNAAPLFWKRMTDSKERRKVVKRNVMTLPYGGTAYGLAEQQITDAKKHGIHLLNIADYGWLAWMGKLVHSSCKGAMPRPMAMLEVFSRAGVVAERRSQMLSWIVPKTRFIVAQRYTEPALKYVDVLFGPPPNPKKPMEYKMSLMVAFHEEQTIKKGKQRAAAAPNIVHSLDAAHLVLLVNRCKEKGVDVSTVHDCFGSLLCDLDIVFDGAKATFVDLYKEDPLNSILRNIGVRDKNPVSRGKYRIEEILESEYAFS